MLGILEKSSTRAIIDDHHHFVGQIGQLERKERRGACWRARRRERERERERRRRETAAGLLVFLCPIMSVDLKDWKGRGGEG